jgi:hypothetical protein
MDARALEKYETSSLVGVSITSGQGKAGEVVIVGTAYTGVMGVFNDEAMLERVDEEGEVKLEASGADSSKEGLSLSAMLCTLCISGCAHAWF